MTMRSIDRARRDGIRWTGNPSQRSVWQQVNLYVAGGARRIPAVIVADDVASWRYDRLDHDETAGYGYEPIPDVRLPYEAIWIEYPSKSGKERRVVLITEETDYLRNLVDGRAPADEVRGSPWFVDAVKAAIDDARGNGETDLQHVVVAFSYIDDLSRIYGPVGIQIYVLDGRGRIAGNRWLFLAGNRMAAALEAEGTEPENFLLAINDVSLWTLALLNMRNVTTVDVQPPVVRRHRKRGNLPPVRYKVLRVRLPGGQLARLDGRIPGVKEPVGLHTVRGHPSHYGDCCPGQHEPRGLLFGKLSGVYWIPAHIAGNRDAGIILKDYEATTHA